MKGAGVLGALGIMAALFGGPAPARGQQIAAEIASAGAQTAFRFAYRPASGQRVDLAFALPRATVDAAARAFATIDMADLQRRHRVEERRLLEAEVVALRARYPQAQIRLRGSGVEYAIAADDANAALRRATDAALRQEVEALRARFPDATIRIEPGGRVSARGPESDMARLGPALEAALRRVEAAQAAQARAFEAGAQGALRAIDRDLDAAIAAIDARMQAFQQSYYAERAYQVTGDRYRPDYRMIAQTSARDLKPLADAWAAQFQSPTDPGAIDALLGFFQSIPYDTLQSRLTSNGAGFAFPVALLARNRGDCDTKSVAFAATLHAAAPTLGIAMVLIPGHALIGLRVPPRRADRTITLAGATYVLAEPVGPRLTRLGEIAESSRRSLREAEILRLF